MTNKESLSRRQFCRSTSFITLVLGIGIVAIGCGGKSTPPTNVTSNQPAATSSKQPTPPAPTTLEVSDAAAPTHALSLPLTAHWTGDFDALVKHKVIRALVVNSKMEFFYDKGRPRGTTAEALQEFEVVRARRRRSQGTGKSENDRINTEIYGWPGWT